MARQNEAKYQSSVIRKIQARFPGCVVLKNDSGYQQGIPDWTILFGHVWAMLEIKAEKKARKQPNQEYFVEKLGGMSFAAFIYPENEEEVLSALEQAFAS